MAGAHTPPRRLVLRARRGSGLRPHTHNRDLNYFPFACHSDSWPDLPRSCSDITTPPRVRKDGHQMLGPSKYANHSIPMGNWILIRMTDGDCKRPESSRARKIKRKTPCNNASLVCDTQPGANNANKSGHCWRPN